MNQNARDIRKDMFREAVFWMLQSSRLGFLVFVISRFLEEVVQLFKQREGDLVAALLGEARSQKDPGNPLV